MHGISRNPRGMPGAGDANPRKSVGGAGTQRIKTNLSTNPRTSIGGVGMDVQIGVVGRLATAVSDPLTYSAHLLYFARRLKHKSQIFEV